ncbi:beta-ketoacyl synthase N-terminal-like domain-containing protein [Saccharomonospora cyanea]|uniref:3-oxoacyl-(Acyl-carrier-protein) synthase n=1 Tax=Saccharomonospora cyanea NA-134 TaxID=882082 RepID=H5XI79_9PSEU|nr:beta-ketoacyl synthase N-terminal-like domain-containing protein [Saccharomonospora cyanea]EHR61707.1 3-oxoacyl-(acyl-carrier-protein) synthase [Saccharomonospora cyanea NA-134]
MNRLVAITRRAVCLPEPVPGTRTEHWEPDPVPPPERAAELLGRKGLLAKEPATRMALCAVHRAFGLPERAPRRSAEEMDPRTAVIVSSNLGNVATVAGLGTALRDGGVRAVSPLDAPNASSNVIASTVAIWFRFGGPNLTVCSGHSSGLDAVGLGRLLLLSGRAGRVVVVGVEPRDEVTDALLTRATGAPGVPVAACVVLEAAGHAEDGGAFLHDVMVESTAHDSGLFADSTTHGRVTVDTGSGGRGYGAEGVLQVAVAAAVVAADSTVRSITAVCGAPEEGFRSTRITAGRG